jgi:hypothetical protein
MGQQLSCLDVKDLQNLENTLEMSLRNIRLKKVTSQSVETSIHHHIVLSEHRH